MFDFESLITDVPNFPKEGVLFKDITTLLCDPEGFSAVVEEISGHFANYGVTKILGAEARGFLVGAPVAVAMDVGFIPARKPGKLPRKTVRQSYDLEYGTDSLEIHADAITPDDVVLIVDDLIATGGTAAASVQLIENMGAKVAGLAFLLELSEFNPRDFIARYTDAEFFSLVEV